MAARASKKSTPSDGSRWEIIRFKGARVEPMGTVKASSAEAAIKEIAEDHGIAPALRFKLAARQVA